MLQYTSGLADKFWPATLSTINKVCDECPIWQNEEKFITCIAQSLSTGRMDPRVGSGRVESGRVTILSDFGGSGRVGSALRIFQFFTDYFLVPKSIWIFEYYIRIDWFSTIFNI